MFDPQGYRDACRELTAPEDKIEEIIHMTNQNQKRRGRPFKVALVAAAAVAMTVVGASAANPQAVQDFFLQIATVIKVDEFREDMTTTDGGVLTVYHMPEVSVENRGDRTVLVVNGEETDITDALERDGRYVYEKSTPEGTELSVTVTGSAKQWEARVSMGKAGEEHSAFTITNEGEWLTPGTAVEGVGGDIGVDLTEQDETEVRQSAIVTDSTPGAYAPQG